MYENIRKPGWLRYTPSVLIRPLPAVYYFARYIQNNGSDDIGRYYRRQILYLENALKTLAKELNVVEFEVISLQFSALIESSHVKRLAYTESAARAMTACCTHWHDTLQEHRSQWVPVLQQIYEETVTPLQILLVDYPKNPSRIEKLRHNLIASCHYKVNCIPGIDETYQAQILEADCVIFTDIQPSRLHRDYERLRSYRRPAIAIIPRDESTDVDKMALRHAGQLSRLGMDILFYYLTPIRLYTTIEKNYIHFHSQSGE